MINKKLLCLAEDQPPFPEVIVAGVPFDSSSTYRAGSRFAPMLVRDASYNLREFNPILGEEITISIQDAGDINPTVGNVQDTLLMIEAEISDLLEYSGKQKPVIGLIGGEHSITYGGVTALEKEKLTIIHLDAHPDLNNRIQGELWNHGTVMRRILDENDYTLIQLGVRAISREEVNLVDNDERIVQISSREIYEGGLPSLHGIKGDVYITVDVDVFDPAYCPDVGNPVPCGIDPLIVEDILYSLIQSEANIVGFDVVEAAGNPGCSTVVNAAKCVYDLISITQGMK